MGWVGRLRIKHDPAAYTTGTQPQPPKHTSKFQTLLGEIEPAKHEYQFDANLQFVLPPNAKRKYTQHRIKSGHVDTDQI